MHGVVFKNKVAMVALAIIIALVILRICGMSPMVPYTYKTAGAWFRGIASMALHWKTSRRSMITWKRENQTANLTSDEAVEKARAEAAAEGKELSRIEESKIRAKANVFLVKRE